MFKVLVHTITLIGISVTIWIIEIKSVARQQEKKSHENWRVLLFEWSLAFVSIHQWVNTKWAINKTDKSQHNMLHI